MKRIGNKIIFLLVLTVLATAIVGSASWLIVQRTGSVVDVADSDTNPCFTSEAYFDGEKHKPVLNELGEAVYGFDSPDDYTIEFSDAEYRFGGDLDSTSTNFQIAAGTYYYKITDNTTGQIISQKHEFVIKPENLVATMTITAPSFVGETVAFTATAEGVHSTKEYEMSGKYTSKGSDYTPSSALICNASVELTISDISSIGNSNTPELIENNFELENASFALNLPLLPTCYSYVGTATADRTYYGNIDQALAECGDTALANASNSYTLVAMQSFTYTYTDAEGVEQTVTPTAKTLASQKNNPFKHEITASAEIPSNLTLLIPYDAAGNVVNRVGGHSSGNGVVNSDSVNDLSGETNNFDDQSKEANGSYKPTLTNKVLLAGNVTLTVKGTLTIGGVLGIRGQGYSLTSDGKANSASPVTNSGPAGVTSGKFSMLEMEESSSVSIEGTLNSYGYVTEATNNTASVTVTATGTVYMPFVIYDYGGGSATVGLYEPGGSSPFNIFDMPNIQSELTCKHGARIIGLASLYTGYKSVNLYITTYESWPSYNATEMTILAPADSNTSKNDEALFIMESGEAVFNYDAAGTYQDNFADGGNYRPDKKAKTDITFAGNVTSGALKMHLTVVEGIVERDVDLAAVYFPVSYKMNVSLTGSYAYTFTSDFKFLPGSSLNVGRNARMTVNSGSSLIFYDNFADGTNDYAESITEIKNYYPTDFRNTPAELNVEGSVTVSGDLAGLINPKAEGAELNLTGASGITLSITEGNGGFSGTSGNFTAIYTETQTANGSVANNGTVANETLAKKTYTASKKDGKLGWKYVLDDITITYNANGGTTPAQKTNSGVYSDVGLTLTGKAYLPDTTRTYYTFAGWYLDSALTSSADGATIYASTTLYAKWTPTTYTTDFRYVGLDEIAEENRPALPANVEFNVEGTVTLPDTPESELTFNGWYLDEACTAANRVSAETISGRALLDNGRVLYGKWVSAQYNVTFENDMYNDVTYPSDTISYTEEQLEGATLPAVKDYTKDASKQYYFLGWYYGDELVTDYSFIDVADTDSTAYTLTAKWVQKYELIINSVSSGGNTAITFDEKVYLYDDAQIKEYFETYDTKAKQYDGDATVNKYFTGWSNGTSTVTSLTTASFDATTKSLTIIPSWDNKVYVKYSANNTSVYTDLVTYGTNEYYKPGTVITLPAITGFDNEWSRQYYLTSWTANGTELSLTATSYTLSENTEIVITWGTKTEITLSTSNGDKITVTHISGGGKTYTSSGYVKAGDKISATTVHGGSNSTSFKMNGSDYKAGTEVEVGTDSVTFSSSSSCIAAGTLITLADGTQKKVEDLLETDMLLVFDHETGRFVEAGIIFIEDDGYDYYNVINLKFSDGTVTKLIYEHALFDATLNKYVYIREDNYSDYVGHEFVIVNNGVTDTVTLDEAYVTYEYTGCYSLVTAYHLNYLIDGLMSIPGGIDGLFNIFEYGDDYRYDEEKMQEDIERYGLYTYRDFEEYIPEEIFHLFRAQYLKISVEKGYITFDGILTLIERYIVGHGLI